MFKRMNYFSVVCAASLALWACSSPKETTNSGNVTIEKHEAEKRVDVMMNNRLFTSLIWPDSIFKPVLYPLVTSAGTIITRGYPIQPRAGERADHPHHTGMWLNYGNVNGIDFWGNSYDIPEEQRKKTGGTIKLVRVDDIKQGGKTASMTAYESWRDPSDKEILAEKTVFEFMDRDSIRIIDRITTLTATNGDVHMPDTKEGMFAIRVARELELPSNEELVLTDASGHPTTVKKMSNEGVSGNYRSSAGVTGEKVWGTRAVWMDLYGKVGNEDVSLVICDHPDNPSYPTWWHARGYGLFAANPLGAKDFTVGKEAVNFVIENGKSVSFRYRIIISSGKHLSDNEINTLANDFGKKY
jgi:hypothetical protein